MLVVGIAGIIRLFLKGWFPVTLKRILLCAPLLAPMPAGAEISGFVEANALHTLLHELGHAVISEFELPVLGQEEDAVDAFATSEIIQMMPEDAEAILTDVALSWLIMDARTDRADLDFFDEHDLDAQRGYRTICHLYGADPEAHIDAADWVEIPEDIRENCEAAGAQAMDSWNAMLEGGALREEGAAKQTIAISYGPTAQFPALRADAMAAELLEWASDYAAENFAWPAPLEIEARECGEVNAYWDPGARRITLCYEILAEWAELEQEAE